jgi:peroxidase
VVSCADILAFAARDAVYVLGRGNISYNVTGGLKDGVNLSAEYADVRRAPGVHLLLRRARQELRQQELQPRGARRALRRALHRRLPQVLSFADRLLLNVSTAGQINPAYQAALTANVTAKTSPYNTNPTEMNNIRDMGCTFQTASGYNATGVNTAANNTLDNSYYTANLQNMVLLKSDWELTTNGFAKGKAGGVQEQRRGLEQRLRQHAMAKLSDLTVTPPAGQY